MDGRRLAYLEALGISAWQLRPARGPQADVETEGDGWEQLQDKVRGCMACGLCEQRTQTVFGVGDRKATLMVVGEAPGAEEDRQGEPFVGPAGQLLDAMLKAAGFEREAVFIANIVKCRPPGNRDPLASETSQCLPYLQRQIELVSPKMILCVGRVAAQNLLATTESVGKLRGRVHQLGGRPLIVTYHPSYLLREPAQKRKAWEDLKLMMQVLKDGSSS